MINAKHPYIVAMIAASASIFSAVTFGQSAHELDRGAAHTLEKFMGASSMDRELAQKASGILIFPHVTKGGAVAGGEFGRGILRVDGTSVAYYGLSGVSMGATLDEADHSEVVLFMTPDGLQRFRDTEIWTVGADAQIAVVTKGVDGTFDSETLRKPILGFVIDAHGSLADVSLEGTRIIRKPI